MLSNNFLNFADFRKLRHTLKIKMQWFSIRLKWCQCFQSSNFKLPSSNSNSVPVYPYHSYPRVHCKQNKVFWVLAVRWAQWIVIRLLHDYYDSIEWRPISNTINPTILLLYPLGSYYKLALFINTVMIQIFCLILVSHMSICNGCTEVGLQGPSHFQFLV